MDLLTRLENIEFRIKGLQSKCEMLEAENKQLKIETTELKSEIELKQEAIINLEEQNKIAKLAGGLNSGEDHSSLKNQLDGLIQEIDQCINLVKR